MGKVEELTNKLNRKKLVSRDPSSILVEGSTPPANTELQTQEERQIPTNEPPLKEEKQEQESKEQEPVVEEEKQEPNDQVEPPIIENEIEEDVTNTVSDLLDLFTTKKQTMEQTHKRETFLIRRDLVERYDELLKDLGADSKGNKTKWINRVIEDAVLELEQVKKAKDQLKKAKKRR